MRYWDMDIRHLEDSKNAGEVSKAATTFANDPVSGDPIRLIDVTKQPKLLSGNYGLVSRSSAVQSAARRSGLVIHVTAPDDASETNVLKYAQQLRHHGKRPRAKSRFTSSLSRRRYALCSLPADWIDCALAECTLAIAYREAQKNGRRSGIPGLPFCQLTQSPDGAWDTVPVLVLTSTLTPPWTSWSFSTFWILSTLWTSWPFCQSSWQVSSTSGRHTCPD
jgi:hypothetical protein